MKHSALTGRGVSVSAAPAKGARSNGQPLAEACSCLVRRHLCLASSSYLRRRLLRRPFLRLRPRPLPARHLRPRLRLPPRQHLHLRLRLRLPPHPRPARPRSRRPGRRRPRPLRLLPRRGVRPGLPIPTPSLSQRRFRHRNPPRSPLRNRRLRNRNPQKRNNRRAMWRCAVCFESKGNRCLIFPLSIKRVVFFAFTV